MRDVMGEFELVVRIWVYYTTEAMHLLLLSVCYIYYLHIAFVFTNVYFIHLFLFLVSVPVYVIILKYVLL